MFCAQENRGGNGQACSFDGDTKREATGPLPITAVIGEVGIIGENTPAYLCNQYNRVMYLVFMCRKGLQPAMSISLPVASLNASARNSVHLDLG